MEPRDDHFDAFDPFDDSDPFADEQEDEFDVEAELERQEEEFWATMDEESREEEAALAHLDDEDDDLWEAAAWADTTDRNTRCPHCGTTWDRIRADGRVGCASCYATFRAHIGGVMVRMQPGAAHVGKAPRAAQKRRLRLEHLRKRRDNQLAVLQSRLNEAVQAERYEEAARLRDKIKVVSTSIFSE